MNVLGGRSFSPDLTHVSSQQYSHKFLNLCYQYYWFSTFGHGWASITFGNPLRDDLPRL